VSTSPVNSEALVLPTQCSLFLQVLSSFCILFASINLIKYGLTATNQVAIIDPSLTALSLFSHPDAPNWRNRFERVSPHCRNWFTPGCVQIWHLPCFHHFASFIHFCIEKQRARAPTNRLNVTHHLHATERLILRHTTLLYRHQEQVPLEFSHWSQSRSPYHSLLSLKFDFSQPSADSVYGVLFVIANLKDHLLNQWFMIFSSSSAFNNNINAKQHFDLYFFEIMFWHFTSKCRLHPFGRSPLPSASEWMSFFHPQLV